MAIVRVFMGVSRRRGKGAPNGHAGGCTLPDVGTAAAGPIYTRSVRRWGPSLSGQARNGHARGVQLMRPPLRPSTIASVFEAIESR